MTAGDFFAELMRDVDAHRALHHPFLERFAAGVDLAQLRRFACQHYAYSRMFIRNVAAVLANTPDENARRLLAINIYEEIGEPQRTRDQVAILISDGIVSRADVARVVGSAPDAEQLTHTALFVRFLRSLGVDSDALDPPLAETVEFVELAHRLCRDEAWLAALGAIGPGTECVVPQLYRKLLAGIARTEAIRPEDYVFWTIHVHCDEGHGRNILDALRPYAGTAEATAQIRRGAMQMLDARARWMDGLHRAVFAAPS